MVKLTISRQGAPATKLNVEIVANQPEELGKNRPVIFILPGGPGADHTVYLNYACLKDVGDLVFHDPRGCGQSDRGDPSTYTMNNYIDDVEAIRKSLKLDKIIVIGKSYGAMCAVGYAIRYPQSVKKLVVSAGAPSHRFLETAKENIARLGTPEQNAVCENLWAGKISDQGELLNYFQLTNSLYSVKARTEPDSFDLVKKSERFSPEVLNQGFKDSYGFFDFENELKKIKCPTLILGGSEDWIVDPKYSELMAKKIPHNQLKIFANASHSLEIDVGKPYFDTIREFIRG